MKKTFNDVSEVKEYHIHIYFGVNRDAEDRAQELTEDIKKLFPSEIVSAEKIGEIGPHTVKNYAIHIKKSGFATVIPWVQLNSRDLSILVHPDRNDDLRDHIGPSMWIGKAVEYNEKFFDKLRNAQQKKLER